MIIISHVRKVDLCCTRLESQKVSRESYSLSAIRVYGIDAINLYFYLCEHGFTSTYPEIFNTNTLT